MNELLSDTRFWLVTLGAAIVGLMKYLLVGHTRRLDVLEAAAVRKHEFEQLRDDMERRHDENRETLAQIAEATTGTHARIDELYRDLIRDRNSR